VHDNDFLNLCFNQAKKFLKHLDVDTHVADLTRSLCDSLNRTSTKKCSIQKSLDFSDSLYPHCVLSFFFILYVYAQSTKKLNLYTQALLLLRRLPCWNKHGSTHSPRSKLSSRLARHATLLYSLFVSSRVESRCDEPSGI